jgi:uncharacterized membrane protein
MKLLIGGLFIWSFVHLIPSVGLSVKKSFINRFGDTIYSIVFSLLIVLSIICMVFGWRSASSVYLYTLPAITEPIASILIIVAFLLFGASMYPTRIKRFIRHPQLASIVVWSSAHLLLNGDSRSLILFGWLGCWAILEIILINKREGLWTKPEVPSWKREIRGSLISIAIFIAILFLHPYIAGVPAI